MQYKEYPNHNTFVIVHNTGFGVTEAPYEEQETVSSFDTMEDARTEADILKIKNNTLEDIQSSWTPNTYHININTLTEQGKQLLNDFHDKFDQMRNKAKSEGLKPIKIGDITVYMNPCKQFDEPIPEKPIRKSRIVWSEINPKNKP